MPCAIPVHKTGLHYSDGERLDMLNLAIQDYCQLEIDEREISKGGNSYTIDTLKELKSKQCSETFCLIIGMDSFMQLKSWKQWGEFSNYAHIVVLRRPDYEIDSLTLTSFETVQDKQLLAERQNGLLYFSSCPMIGVSSSEIRGKITANKNLDDLLPKTIINYIKKQ